MDCSIIFANFAVKFQLLNLPAMIKSVAIIGGGNMGGAIARGLAQGTLIKEADITVADPFGPTLDKIQEEYPNIKTTTNNCEAVQGKDLVLVVVKPWLAEKVFEQIKPVLDFKNQLIATVIGGMKLDKIDDMLGVIGTENIPSTAVIIPNTGIAVLQSMTFMSTRRCSKEQQDELVAIFNELGRAMLVEEHNMGAGTAIASCGIAYAMRYVRAAMEGGVQLGFRPEEAKVAVLQTMLGAAALLFATGEHPEAAIDRVTTAGGITIKGLNAMEAAGFTPAVIAGLIASCPK